jgi:hypothetical protein
VSPLRVRTRQLIVAAALAAFLPAPAAASEHFADHDVRRPTLKVDAKGRALVEYSTQQGRRRHVLVWGAINTNHPSSDVKQVRFKYDFTGGRATYKRPIWRTFANSCKPYDGPALAYFVAGCKARDGSYWALQTWQRRLPLLGFTPWGAVEDTGAVHV